MLTELLLLLLFTAYALLYPWTKVEESFNVQAMHDIFYYGTNLSQYDHNEFPGVVPRTFAGATLVTALATPALALMRYIDAPKYCGLIVVRATLAFLVWLSWRRVHNVVAQILGNATAKWMTVLTLTQFHFAFYASRPLPNTFALVPCLLALSEYALAMASAQLAMDTTTRRRRLLASVALATFSAFVFRSELILLYAPYYLYAMYMRHLHVGEAIGTGVLSAAVSLALTVPLDSWLWQRTLWPELSVFVFNVVENKSHQWGIMPLLWYFYSALPRALGLSFTLVPIGLFLERRTRPLVLPALLFIAAYSLLPHKELRFIIYTLPVLNVAAASACQRIIQNYSKSALYKMLSLAVYGHLLVNCCLALVALYTAAYNYAGGDALWLLQRSIDANERTRPVHVYIDNYCAQTGVSRWLHEYNQWIYNKTERLSINEIRMSRQFGYLLLGAPGGELENLTRQMRPRFTTWFTIEAFERIHLPNIDDLKALSFLPDIITSPTVAVMSYTPPQ